MTSKENSNPPQKKYGVVTQDFPKCEIDEIVEQIQRLGFGVLESGISSSDLNFLSERFNHIRSKYVSKWNKDYLDTKDEIHSIRALLSHGENEFASLACNKKVLQVISRLISGKFILNQQNGVINPPNDTYNQGAWHRDLPYQHFISDTPLAVNALFCIDEFTVKNGSTWVLPATHKTKNYPSNNYIKQNAIQLEAKAGCFIILDCMVYHSGGLNFSKNERRGVNHVYTIPYFKQQINLHPILEKNDWTDEQQELFGFTFQEPQSIQDFLDK